MNCTRLQKNIHDMKVETKKETTITLSVCILKFKSILFFKFNSWVVCNKPLSYADHCLKFKYVNVNQETIIKAMALIRINGASIPFFFIKIKEEIKN